MNQHFSQYLKNLNRVGWIKWAFVLAGGVFTFIGTSTEPVDAHSENLTWAVPVIFVAFCIIIPGGLKLSSIFYDIQIEWPLWNDSPYITRKPLIFFDFIGAIFLFAGLSRLLATSIYRHYLDIGGLILLSGCIGIFTGIFLTVKWVRTNNPV
jgi:hypothetical protein